MPRLAPLALLAAAFASPAFPQATYTTLQGPGGNSISIEDCSDDGRSLSGVTPYAGAASGAFLWTDTNGFRFLPQVGVLFPPWARCISGDGQTVLGGIDSFPIGYEAFRWDETNGLTLLPTVGGASEVLAVNRDASMIGGSAYVGASDQPALWIGSAPAIGLPSIPGTARGAVTAVSEVGVVAGYRYKNQGQLFLSQRAFRWDAAGGLQILEGTPSQPFSRAWAISADGEIVVGTISADGRGGTLVRWDSAGVMERLFDLPPQAVSWQSVSCDASARTIAGCYWTPNIGFIESFRWTESEGLQTFSELLQDLGLSQSQGVPQVSSISADGNVLVGDEFVGPPFLLRLHPDPLERIGVPICDPSVANSIGASPGLQAFGLRRVTANELTLSATELPPNTFGMMVAGRSPGTTPMVGGGVGTLCIAGSLGRFDAPGEIRSTGPLGRASLRVDLTAVPTGPGDVQVMPGETWIFQLWYRDRIGGVSTSNLTSACAVTFN